MSAIAKGKENAANIKVGDRIVVRVERNDARLMTHIAVSQTKTHADDLIVRVTGKTYGMVEQGWGRAGRRYVIETTAGTFEAAPIQTMILAPEDAAGIKRAHAQAIAENDDRDAAAYKAEREAAAAAAAAAPAETPAPSNNGQAAEYERQTVVVMHEADSPVAGIVQDNAWRRFHGIDTQDKNLEAWTAAAVEADWDEALAMDAPNAVRRLRERILATAWPDERQTLMDRLAWLGAVLYPAGTREYRQYATQLREELARPGAWDGLAGW